MAAMGPSDLVVGQGGQSVPLLAASPRRLPCVCSERYHTPFADSPARRLRRCEIPGLGPGWSPTGSPLGASSVFSGPCLGSLQYLPDWRALGHTWISAVEFVRRKN